MYNLCPCCSPVQQLVQIVIDGLIVIVWDKAGDSLSHHQTDNHKTTRLVERDFAKDGNMCSLKTVSVQLANLPCLPACLLACVHTRGGGVEAGKQSYNMQEADECCLPIYLPLDASLPHCSLMLSSARAFFAHCNYEQRCEIFQICARHILLNTLKLQSALLDLHPCLQFRCLLAGLALWGGRRKGKPRSSRQLAGEWHNLPPLRWSQPAGGKGGTAADETERGMDKCDQKQVCKCSTTSSSLSLSL